MKKISVLATLIFAAILCGFTWQLHDPFYLSKDAIDVSTELPPPPAHGSAVDQADLAKVRGYQRTRTAKDCERAGYEVEVSLEHLFGPKYGPLTQAEVQKLSVFVDKARNDTDWFVQLVKKKWNRPRPFLADSTLSPCAKREVTNAYPSGHAAISRVMADVLSKWDPSREAQFRARAERIAEDRILAGVHHPTDIAAGKKMGDDIFAKLMANPAFQKDLQSLKTEN